MRERYSGGWLACEASEEKERGKGVSRVRRVLLRVIFVRGKSLRVRKEP